MTKRERAYHHSILIKKIMLQDVYWNKASFSIDTSVCTLKRLNRMERRCYFEQLAQQPQLAKIAQEMDGLIGVQKLLIKASLEKA